MVVGLAGAAVLTETEADMKRIFPLLFALCAGSALPPLSARELPPNSRTPQTTAPAANEAERFIRHFYTNCVFGNAACGPILEKCCTQRLLRKLRADYGYDGEGYAVWLFRTGAQDGPGGVSEVREVAALGDGRYRADFVDMGTEGCRIVKIVDENGAMKIDAVE